MTLCACKDTNTAIPSSSGSITALEALREVFHLKSKDAAQALEINQSTLKNICRRQGIDRWPQRKLSSLESLRLSIIIETSGMFDEEISKTAGGAAAGIAGSTIMCSADALDARNHHSVDDTTKKARLQELIQLIQLNYQMILEDPNKPVCTELEDLRCKMHKRTFAYKQQSQLRSSSADMPSSENSYDVVVPKKMTAVANYTTALSSWKNKLMLAHCVPAPSASSAAVFVIPAAQTAATTATPLTPFVQQQLAHCGDQINHQYNLTAEHHSHHFSSENDGLCSITSGRSGLVCTSSSSSAVVADDFVSAAPVNTTTSTTRSGAALTSMTSWAMMMMTDDEEDELLPSEFVNDCNDEMMLLLAPDETVRASRQQLQCCLGNFYEAPIRQGSVSSLPVVMPEILRDVPPSKTGPSSALEAALLELLPSKDEEIGMSHDAGQQKLMMPLHVTTATVRAAFGTDSHQVFEREKQCLNKSLVSSLVVGPARPFSIPHHHQETKETQLSCISCDEYHNMPPSLRLKPATSVLSCPEQGRKTVLDLHGGASHYMHRSMVMDLHYGGASHYMHHSRLAAAATVAVSDTALVEGQQQLQLPSQAAVAVNSKGSNCATSPPVTFDMWSTNKRRQKEDNQLTEHVHVHVHDRHANNWIIHEINNLHAAFSSSSSGPPMQQQCMHGLLPQEPGRKSKNAASHNHKRHHIIMPQGAALITNQGTPSLRCHETGRIVDYPRRPIISSQHRVLDCHKHADCEPSPIILTHPAGHQPPPPHHCNQYALQEATRRPAETAAKTMLQHKHIPDGIISISESEHVTSSYSSSPISSALNVGGKKTRIPHLHHHNETISQHPPQELDACKEKSTTLAAGLIGCQPACMSASGIPEVFHALDSSDHQQYNNKFSLQHDGPDDFVFVWAMLLD